MPISETELKAMAGLKGDQAVERSGACRKCKYDFAGLRGDTIRCPECGMPINAPRVKRFGDQMTDAPRDWIASHQRAAFMLALSATLATVLTSAFAIFRRSSVTVEAGVLLGAIGVAGAIWSISVFPLTRVRPGSEATAADRLSELKHARVVARWSQMLWPIGLFWLLGAWTLMAGSAVLLSVGVMLLIAAIAGVFPLFVVLSDRAHWATDTSTADQLRVASWVFPTGVLLNLVVVLTGHYALFGGILGMIVVFIVGAFFFIIPMAIGLKTLWAHWRMARWALVNNIGATLRDARIRERAERERLRGPLPSPQSTPVRQSKRL
jgi:hypothetical protein